jgi:hypothetical protein
VHVLVKLLQSLYTNFAFNQIKCPEIAYEIFKKRVLCEKSFFPSVARQVKFCVQVIRMCDWKCM